MINNERTIQEIINSIMNFSFEFDIEKVKQEMELKEVSDDELEKLGESQVNQKFNNGEFKIKMPNGGLFDVNSIKEQSSKKGIKEPVVYINPNFKYVKWTLRKDFTTQQIKKHIKKQLTNSSEVDINEIKKALLIEETKSKEVEGYIGELAVKTSQNISQGKFHIQSSCSKESAINLVFEHINEIEIEKDIYVNKKIRSDYKKLGFYLIFLVCVSILWFINSECKTLPNWVSTSIAFTLFLISFLIMRLINHKIFDTLLSKKKVIKKYEQEFYIKTSE
ncbi:hypothetical protein [Tenacibaculum mesophilum]|uniref:hypothetical protein n=1 Tax=Tenacibaculum mesophilum TaxID=104268 RepID=UPI002492BED4|nr:hypothetical protein [Tenacibaculum mesophilum]